MHLHSLQNVVVHPVKRTMGDDGDAKGLQLLRLEKSQQVHRANCATQGPVHQRALSNAVVQGPPLRHLAWQMLPLPPLLVKELHQFEGGAILQWQVLAELAHLARILQSYMSSDLCKASFCQIPR